MDMKEEDIVLSEAAIKDLRKGVAKRREELFRKKWKNERPLPPLRSLHQEKTFKFVIEWYEEFDEVVGRERERNRLDRLIEQGEDVNAKENRK